MPATGIIGDAATAAVAKLFIGFSGVQLLSVRLALLTAPGKVQRLLSAPLNQTMPHICNIKIHKYIYPYERCNGYLMSISAWMAPPPLPQPQGTYV
jgi:hypothetical protein